MSDEVLSRGESISLGMIKSRANGTRLGRPPSEKESQIEELLRKGWTQTRVRRELNAGVETVRRVANRIKGKS